MQFSIWSSLFALIVLTFSASLVQAQTLAPFAIPTIACAEEANACIVDAVGEDADLEDLSASGCDETKEILACYKKLVSDDVDGCAELLDEVIVEGVPTQIDALEEVISENCPSCLSGDMLVQTMSGMKQTKDLSVGDMVSVGSGKFEPVVWNSQHYGGNDNVRATFVEFELSNGEKIAMTPTHFAKTTEGAILAGNVKVGQVMITGKDEAVIVESTERTTKQGVYNPQTPSQQIEVNGVVVTTRSKDSPSFMGAIFQVLAFFHSLAPSAVYSTIIENISHFVYEPLMFGQNAWALPVATLFFAGAGVKALKA